MTRRNKFHFRRSVTAIRVVRSVTAIHVERNDFVKRFVSPCTWKRKKHYMKRSFSYSFQLIPMRKGTDQ
jgi:hypothetical protein